MVFKPLQPLLPQINQVFSSFKYYLHLNHFALNLLFHNKHIYNLTENLQKNNLKYLNKIALTMKFRSKFNQILYTKGETVKLQLKGGKLTIIDTEATDGIKY